MTKRILAEAAIVAIQTVVLIALSATVGISRSAPGSARAESGRSLGLDRYRWAPVDNPERLGKVKPGLRLFRGEANCTACHVGLTMTDEEFHNTGVARKDGEFLDEGRYTVTNKGRRISGSSRRPPCERWLAPPPTCTMRVYRRWPR